MLRGQEVDCFRLYVKVNRVDLYCLLLWPETVTFFFGCRSLYILSINKHSDYSKTHIQFQYFIYLI